MLDDALGKQLTPLVFPIELLEILNQPFLFKTPAALAKEIHRGSLDFYEFSLNLGLDHVIELAGYREVKLGSLLKARMTTLCLFCATKGHLRPLKL